MPLFGTLTFPSLHPNVRPSWKHLSRRNCQKGPMDLGVGKTFEMRMDVWMHGTWMAEIYGKCGYIIVYDVYWFTSKSLKFNIDTQNGHFPREMHFPNHHFWYLCWFQAETVSIWVFQLSFSHPHHGKFGLQCLASGTCFGPSISKLSMRPTWASMTKDPTWNAGSRISMDFPTKMKVNG